MLLFRDDSLRWWDILRAYNNDVLSLFYADDDDVTRDGELTAMLTDLRRNGFHKKSKVPER